MNGKELSQALRSGRRVYGTCIVSTAPHWPKQVKKLNIDFVFIDTEHIPNDRHMLGWICHTYAAMGIAPIVRVPEPEPFRACMVLDGGASGVIAPYVETAEQVRALAGAVKFRPLKGRRLRNTLEGKEALEPEVRDYLETWNEDNVLVINIESVPAIEALDEILSVPGLDAVLIGPHDLSINLGIPEQYEHPRFDAAVRTIIRKARERGVGAGIHYNHSLQQEIDWAKDGANFIVHSSDLYAFRVALDAELKQIRRALGDVAADKTSGNVTI